MKFKDIEPSACTKRERSLDWWSFVVIVKIWFRFNSHSLFSIFPQCLLQFLSSPRDLHLWHDCCDLCAYAFSCFSSFPLDFDCDFCSNFAHTCGKSVRKETLVYVVRRDVLIFEINKQHYCLKQKRIAHKLVKNVNKSCEKWIQTNESGIVHDSAVR